MRRPRSAPLLRALALALPILEVLAIVEVAHWIGAAWTFLLLVAGVVAGVWLIRRVGQRSWRALRAGLLSGASPEGLAGNGWVVLAGVLLIVPGFITDVAAAVLLFPPTRSLISRRVARTAANQTGWVPPTMPPNFRPPAASNTDDAEPTVVRGDVL